MTQLNHEQLFWDLLACEGHRPTPRCGCPECWERLCYYLEALRQEQLPEVNTDVDLVAYVLARQNYAHAGGDLARYPNSNMAHMRDNFPKIYHDIMDDAAAVVSALNRRRSEVIASASRQLTEIVRKSHQ